MIAPPALSCRALPLLRESDSSHSMVRINTVPLWITSLVPVIPSLKRGPISAHPTAENQPGGTILPAVSAGFTGIMLGLSQLTESPLGYSFRKYRNGLTLKKSLSAYPLAICTAVSGEALPYPAKAVEGRTRTMGSFLAASASWSRTHGLYEYAPACIHIHFPKSVDTAPASPVC